MQDSQKLLLSGRIRFRDRHCRPTRLRPLPEGSGLLSRFAKERPDASNSASWPISVTRNFPSLRPVSVRCPQGLFRAADHLRTLAGGPLRRQRLSCLSQHRPCPGPDQAFRLAGARSHGGCAKPARTSAPTRHGLSVLLQNRPRALHTARRQTKGHRMNYLDFEKPLAEIEGKAEELRALARPQRPNGRGAGGRRPRPEGRGHAARPLQVAHALAEMPGGRVTPTGRIARTISKRFSPNTRPWPVTAISPTTMR